MFVFKSNSADKKPGKGVHEHGDPADYPELAAIKDWRKVLSNFHVAPFKFDGHTYNSIEHVFQSKKIALADCAQALKFTVESGDPIGQGDGKVAQKNRKLVKLSQKQLDAWDIIKEDVMRNAAIEKYKASSEARQVLKATKSAKLYHIETQRGKPSNLVHFKHLEDIRSTLV